MGFSRRILNDKVSQNVATTFAHISWDKKRGGSKVRSGLRTLLTNGIITFTSPLLQLIHTVRLIAISQGLLYYGMDGYMLEKMEL